MIRWSITDKKEIFQSAVVDVMDLSSKGMSKNEIIQTLSPKYQEKDIDQLSQWINDVPKLAQYKSEKLMLKISLWILLAGKVLGLIALPRIFGGGTLWEIAFVLLYPVINIVDLVLAYRVTANSFFIIFFTTIASLSSLSKLVDSLFTPGADVINWVMTLIAVSTYIGAAYYSFKLSRVLPSGLIRTNGIMSRLKLKVKTVSD